MHLLFNSDASELLLKTHQDLSVLLPCSLIRFSSLPLTRFLAFRLHRANSRAVLALHRPCVKGNKERVNKTNTVAIYCPLEWVHFTAEPVTRGKFGGRGRVPILLEYGSEVKFDSILHASRRTKLVTTADLVTSVCSGHVCRGKWLCIIFAHGSTCIYSIEWCCIIW